MRATLIHHPCGGSADDDDIARARALLGAHFDLDVYPCADDRPPQVLAREALARGSQLLVAAGGDGTVSGVASALVNHPGASLGILPQGTANSIAGHLGIASNVEGACNVIVAGHERTIDTATVNGRPMLLMATLGVHADAITEADPEQKRKYGVLAYVLEEVSRLLDDSLFEVEFETPAGSFRSAASAVTVANLAPPTTLLAQGPASIIDDDGLLDVTLVAIEGIADAIATPLHLAVHALAGLPASRPNIAFFRTPSIRISTKEPKRVMIDGEDAGEVAIDVRVVPRSLRVRTPA